MMNGRGWFRGPESQDQCSWEKTNIYRENRYGGVVGDPTPSPFTFHPFLFGWVGSWTCIHVSTFKTPWISCTARKRPAVAQELAAAGVRPPSPHPTSTAAPPPEAAAAGAGAAAGASTAPSGKLKRRRVLPAHLRDSDLGDASCSPAAAALATSSQQGGPAAAAAAQVPAGPVCVCRCVAGGDSVMVACCSCRDWYHQRCVLVGQVQAKALRSWTCPVCEAVRVRACTLPCSPTRSPQWCKPVCRVIACDLYLPALTAPWHDTLPDCSQASC